MAKEFLFETETCGRCGGTGNYSYCQMHGTTCFGCGGNKVRLTKRGVAAQKWFHDQQTVDISQLKVGDSVYESDFNVRGWFRVDKIEGDTVTLSYRVRHGTERKELALGGFKKFRTRPADAFGRRWQQMVALAYQATLTKAGKPRKGK